MGWLSITESFIREKFFPNLDCEIVDASFDPTTQVLQLRIEGADVPEGDETKVLCHSIRDKGCTDYVRVELLPPAASDSAPTPGEPK